MRRSSIYLGFSLSCLVALGFLCFIYPHLSAEQYDQILAEQKRVVRDLQLTDLCLFSEARYTRNLSQADWHAPFQDNPMAFDTFPSGSLVRPTVLLADDTP